MRRLLATPLAPLLAGLLLAGVFAGVATALRPLFEQPILDLIDDGGRTPTGTCLVVYRAMENATSVPCEQPHDAEVVGRAAVAPPGAPWPGPDSAVVEGEAACPGFVAPPGFRLRGVAISEEVWSTAAAHGAVVTTCLAEAVDGGRTTGSLR